MAAWISSCKSTNFPVKLWLNSQLLPNGLNNSTNIDLLLICRHVQWYMQVQSRPRHYMLEIFRRNRWRLKVSFGKFGLPDLGSLVFLPLQRFLNEEPRGKVGVYAGAAFQGQYMYKGWVGCWRWKGWGQGPAGNLFGHIRIWFLGFRAKLLSWLILSDKISTSLGWRW